MDGLFEGITIDPVGAADLDDAIKIDRDARGWTVQIAFPRLTDAVRVGSHADGTARRRLETRYRPGGVAKHMLPDEVMKAASLTPGACKPVFLVTVRLDGSFRPTSTDVSASTFRSLGRLTYGEASRSVQTGAGSFAEMLGQARDLAYGLFERRRSSGAIAYYDLERGIAFDEEGSAILLTGEGHVAEMIVSELMVLANAQLASFAMERNIPLLYRNHEALGDLTREQILGTLLGAAAHDRADVQTKGLPRIMAKARIGAEPKGHYALNLPAYAWFTSPLRRYVDLVNQRMIEAALDGHAAPHDIAALEAVARQVDEKRNADSDRMKASFRGRYAREATAIIAGGRIEDADDLQFRRVVRAVAADPAAATEAVVDESVRRIAEDLLTPKEIARLLILGGRTAAAVVERLRAAPHEANNILAYGSTSLGWSQPDFSEQRAGPPHAPVFACSGRMTVAGAELVTPLVVRPTRKGAQHAAGVHLVAAVAGIEVPETAEPPVQAPSPRPAPAAGPELNPRNRLQEYCARAKHPAPTYEVSERGPPHDRVFEAVATVRVGGRTISSPSASARSKKEAEKAAAVAMLVLMGLEEPGAVDPPSPAAAAPPAADVDDMARTRLETACRKRKWPMPRFEVKGDGPSHAPTFTAVARLRAGGRDLVTPACAGRSKKEAERVAARAMLDLVERPEASARRLA